MPPANPHSNVIAFPPRTLANVLIDLKEAQRDWDQADHESECAAREDNLRLEDEAGDRMSEADQRIDALRDEFARRFEQAAGLTWKQIDNAFAEGLL